VYITLCQAHLADAKSGTIGVWNDVKSLVMKFLFLMYLYGFVFLFVCLFSVCLWTSLSDPKMNE